MKFIVPALALSIFLLGCLGPPKAPSDFVECNFDEKCSNDLMDNCWKGHFATKSEERIGEDLSVSVVMDLTVIGPNDNKCTFEFSFSEYQFLDPAHKLDQNAMDTLNATIKQKIYGKKATCQLGLAEMMEVNLSPEKFIGNCTGPLIEVIREET